jgi:hypothetical protein
VRADDASQGSRRRREKLKLPVQLGVTERLTFQSSLWVPSCYCAVQQIIRRIFVNATIYYIYFLSHAKPLMAYFVITKQENIDKRDW